jgi:hypothetical protein
MIPRNSPLEPWEWIAILERLDRFDPAIRELLPTLVQAQIVARRCAFIQRTCWAADPTPPRSLVTAASRKPAARLEHRLYTLFAE